MQVRPTLVLWTHVCLLTLPTMAFRVPSVTAVGRPTAFITRRVKTPLFASTNKGKGPSQSHEAPDIPPLAPTDKRLFLVRHGEVVNPGGDRPVYYGAQDVPLSLLGEKEAKAAADYLCPIPLARVFASPLQRAIFGAQQVAQQQRDLSPEDVVILEGFTELERGAWCGKTKQEIGDDLMQRFDACDESVTPEGGESYPALKRRVLQARDQCLSMLEPGQSGCVVSHLQVTRCLLSDCLGIPTNEMAGLKIATASITCIDYDATGQQTCHFQSYKPNAGLAAARDGAN